MDEMLCLMEVYYANENYYQNEKKKKKKWPQQITW